LTDLDLSLQGRDLEEAAGGDDDVEGLA